MVDDRNGVPSGATSIWDPASFLSAASSSFPATPSFERPLAEQYAVILLNQRIAEEQRELLRQVWNGARLRICADGGANRLHEAFEEDDFFPATVGSSSTASDQPKLCLPDAIVGDLDSFTTSSRDFFTSKRVRALYPVDIAERPSQYATDLQKSIQWIEDWEDRLETRAARATALPDQDVRDRLQIVIWGGLSGRMDQTAHTLHVLWKLAPRLPCEGGYEDPEAGLVSEPTHRQRGGLVEKRPRTWVVGEESLLYLLPPGTWTLRHQKWAFENACGTLPFGTVGGNDKSLAARVRTSGLEWDLDPEQPQSIGGYMSTSNHLTTASGSAHSQDEAGDAYWRDVRLETDRPIYWSIQLAQQRAP